MAAGAPAPTAQERREWLAEKCGEWLAMAFWVLVFVLIVLGAASQVGPVYYVAISSVTGLDPATDLPRPTLSPAFNLTVRIAPWPWGDACLDVGSAVSVSYRRVPLAAAAVPSKLCAAPGASGWDGSVSVVASGHEVRVPGAVMDALAWDLWGFGGAAGGRPEFEVTLTVPYEGGWKMVSCRAKVGGIAALHPPCDVSVVRSVKAAPMAAAGVGIQDVAKPEKGDVVRVE